MNIFHVVADTSTNKRVILVGGYRLTRLINENWTFNHEKGHTSITKMLLTCRVFIKFPTEWLKATERAN